MDSSNVASLVAKILELEKENARLKAILDKHGITYKEEEIDRAVRKEYVTSATSSKFSFAGKGLGTGGRTATACRK